MLWLAKALCSGGHSTFPALAKPSQGFATRLGKLGKLPEKVDLPDVKAAVAIASGKGGVGKSTTTANVAVALAKNPGFKIGILDADVFGPSQPRLFGLKGRPQPSAAQKMIPLQNHGVHVMSMGFLLEEDAPAVWRGPMVMSAIDTFLQKVEWGDLDLLLVDMPPGTGAP
ncbi:hypothetical protein WJX84_005135 [Apatococcus fuscideae]|uniref:NUBPL n=1 Tax=Apatococcus fuscideae TaxID=2026836 RepID=A0AAW1SQN7_9CHLO